jgi:uncharacterized repeat protein (TIGR02543 family)
LILPNSLSTIVAPVVDVSSGTFAHGNFDVVKYCGSSSTVRDYPFNVAITCGAVVRFDSNLGTGSIPDQSSNTNTAVRPNTFSRNGFTFSGWNTEANGTGTPYAADATFPFSTAADTTLFAQWTITPYNSSSGNGNVSCSASGYFTIASNVVTGNTNCAGTVTIPSGVTSLAEDAFTANTSITSVDIPSTVQTIGMAAFYANTSLATVTFQANSQLTSIGSAAFERTAIASITLPSSLTFLGNYAFYGNAALTSITIPEGVTQILQNTFESATALTSVNLPSTLTTIQVEVFKGTALTSITIPSSVTSIGTDAFANTAALNTYTYCGAISSTDLTAAGLGGKTKASCSVPVVYVAPTPVPYLKTLTTPKLNLKDGKLVCTPGTYNAGYTLNGVIQGSVTALFTPSTFTYNILINGIAQISLAITAGECNSIVEHSLNRFRLSHYLLCDSNC